jgi:nucleotide-binding universal stress UspA family protein
VTEREIEEDMELHRIAVLVDGSPESQRAVEWCAEHLGPTDEVVAVAGLSNVGELVLAVPPSNLRMWRREIRRSLYGTWTQPLTDRGIPHRERFIEMTPWRALRKVGDEIDADALVIGVGNHKGLAGLIDPREASHVLHKSRRPVLVVPSP